MQLCELGVCGEDGAVEGWYHCGGVWVLVERVWMWWVTALRRGGSLFTGSEAGRRDGGEGDAVVVVVPHNG